VVSTPPHFILIHSMLIWLSIVGRLQVGIAKVDALVDCI
jgi:hypothetical protein